MSPEKAGGMPSTDDDFHMAMRALYRDQRFVREDLDDQNQYHVQAKLPSALYRDFHALLKEKGWSISTGVQYAIHKLSQQKQEHS